MSDMKKHFYVEEQGEYEPCYSGQYVNELLLKRDAQIESLTAKLKAAEEALEGIHAISLCTETFASIDTVKEVKDMSRQALEAIRSGK